MLAIPDVSEAWGQLPTTLLDAVLVSYAERHELSPADFERHHPGGAIDWART